jgi:hypothetical protein
MKPLTTRQPAGKSRTGRVRRRVLAAIGLVALAACAAAAFDDQPDPATRRGWEAQSRLRFREALDAFDQAGPSRAARFGRAMALLNVQPKTQENIEQAATILDALAAEDGDDEFGIAGAYFRARI